MRSRRAPVELVWMYMSGVPPATTRFSPLEEKAIARTVSVWEMVACRVSCESHIFTVWPAAVAVVPKGELELAWEGEIATALTSSWWGALAGGA